MLLNLQNLLGPFFTVFLLLSQLHGEEKAASKSLESLESQLVKIDQELENLSNINLRYGVGNIGWLSAPSKTPRQAQWAEIKFSKSTQFETIVLVPMLWNDPEKGPLADAFPIAFQVIAGEHGDPTGSIIASLGREDNFLPRVAPLIIEVPPTTAGWVRIESIELSKDRRANRNMLGFSEIMVFHGEHNVALAQPVKTSSQVGGWGSPAISSQALTDGITPYLMNAKGESSNSYMAFFRSAKIKLSIVVDLEKSYPIDEIHLHNGNSSEQIPRIHEVDFGIPFHLLVQGANEKDFSDAVPLLNYTRKTVYDVGPVISRNIPPQSCRYLRLQVAKPYEMPAGSYQFAFGLSEIVVNSKGQNVALGKTVQCRPESIVRHENQDSLVDGKNHFGEILSMRSWMDELARRHELQNQRPIIAQSLQKKYSHQKATLRWMSWLIALLLIGIIFIVLFDRMVRLRAVLRVRERLAANLHDEVSANLQALVLLSDMAKSNLDNTGKLANILNRIHRISVRNRTHARLFMQQLQGDTIIEDLESEMRRSADRLLSNLEQNLELDELKNLQNLSQRKKNDLFLFFQECLINIARHADASNVHVEVITTPGQGQLIVTDDGRGVTEVPPSLARRARFLRAKVHVSTPKEGGTAVSLTFPHRKNFFLQRPEPSPNESHESHQAPTG